MQKTPGRQGLKSRALKHESCSCGAVIVNWNTKVYLDLALRSFVRDGIRHRDIVIVDQGSSDGSVRWVKKHFSGVRILSLPENRSYGGAINAGIARLVNSYVVAANADVEFPNGTIESLKAVLDNEERVAVAGPSLRDSRGRNTTRFSPAGVVRAVVLVLAPGVLRGLWRSRRRQRSGRGEAGPVKFVEGSFMMMRRTAFDEVGGFDDNFSFFYEEGDFELRLRKLGYLLFHVPNAVVIHHGGASFSQAPGRAMVEFYKNALRYFRIHASRKYLWLKRFLVPVLGLRLILRWRTGRNGQAGNKEPGRTLLEFVREGEERKSWGRLPERPLVSVIIPTVNRVNCLITLLKSLQRQSYDNYEIIVVDQSEYIDSQKTIAFKSFGKRLKLISSERRNRSHAKNLGIHNASGDLLLFIDDDIEAPGDLLETHVAAYQDTSVGAVSCRLTEERLPAMKTDRILRVTYYGRVVVGYQSDVTCYVRSIFGGNMSIPREVQSLVGEFDTTFGGTSLLEEADLSARIGRVGLNLLFTNRTSAVHYPQEDGNHHLNLTKPAMYYHWFHHNEILYFLKNHCRLTLFLVIPFCLLRTARQSRKFHLNRRDTTYVFSGVIEGFKTYYRLYQ